MSAKVIAGGNIDAPTWRTEALPEAGQNNPIDQFYVDSASVWANVFGRINIDAPVPSYEIDRIALDYCATGLLHFGSQVFDEYKTTGLDSSNDDLVLLVRMFVVTGAYCGIYLLEGQSKTAERLELTKSHFDDLQVIKTRIRRDGLERMMIRRRDGGDGNEIRDLFAAFERIDVAIDNYLKAYEPKGSKGRQSRLSFKRSHPLHIGFVVRANDL